MTIGTSEYPLAALPVNRTLEPWIEQMTGVPPIVRRHVMKNLRPPVSWFLYKYHSANKPHTLTNLRDTLVKSLLRLGSTLNFNDPFELAACFSLEGSDDERRARFEAMAKELEPHRGWRAIQSRIEALMTTSAEALKPQLISSLDSLRRVAGIYCFAGAAKDTLMWSHYASDHKGVCLIFERAYDVRTLLHALPVSYSEIVLPVLHWIRSFHEDIGKMLFAKHPAWSYEAESRIMINYQAGRYLPFEPAALRGLIFGCRADLAFISEVEEIVHERSVAGHPPLRIYRAHMHPTKYRLIVHQHQPSRQAG